MKNVLLTLGLLVSTLGAHAQTTTPASPRIFLDRGANNVQELVRRAGKASASAGALGIPLKTGDGQTLDLLVITDFPAVTDVIWFRDALLTRAELSLHIDERSLVLPVKTKTRTVSTTREVLLRNVWVQKAQGGTPRNLDEIVHDKALLDELSK